MTKLEKLYCIIENSCDVGVKLPKGVLQQVEELEEGIIKEEILPALSSDIAPRLNPIQRDLVLVVVHLLEYQQRDKSRRPQAYLQPLSSWAKDRRREARIKESFQNLEGDQGTQLRGEASQRRGEAPQLRGEALYGK